MQYMIPTKVKGYRSGVINALIDCVKMLYPMQSLTIRREFTTNGVRYSTYPKDDYTEDPTIWAFGVTVAGKTVTIEAGPIFVQGVIRVDMAKKADLTATGEYCWPTVKIPISAVSTASFIAVSSIPTPDQTNIYVPLVRLKCTDWATTKESYDKDGAGHILHRGAIHLANPLVFA